MKAGSGEKLRELFSCPLSTAGHNHHRHIAEIDFGSVRWCQQVFDNYHFPGLPHCRSTSREDRNSLTIVLVHQNGLYQVGVTPLGNRFEYVASHYFASIGNARSAQNLRCLDEHMGKIEQNAFCILMLREYGGK